MEHARNDSIIAGGREQASQILILQSSNAEACNLPSLTP